MNPKKASGFDLTASKKKAAVQMYKFNKCIILTLEVCSTKLESGKRHNDTRSKDR